VVRFRPAIPKIRGTQVGLKNPALVDQIKADMREGRFAYHELRARIGGIRDRKGTYYVGEGHHRTIAALEIYYETGDAAPLLELLRHGAFTNGPPPLDRCVLPLRSWWARVRNRLGI